ncbi:MAG: hypothetical protein ABSF53_18675 [Terracidiphilus sp.]|jgi:hypothetical protein
MTAPLRGTQSLVGQMGWVFSRPWLIAIEIAWRWVFGIPFLALCWIEAQKILTVVPPETAGLNAIDGQNPWVASVQIAHAWAIYQPHVSAVLSWLAPVTALAWVVISGFGRSLVLHGIDPALSGRRSLHPVSMVALQACWLALFGATWWGWFRSMAWVAATHITAGAEPDLIGFACWAIFLSLGFFTASALVSWPLSIAPLVMLLEGCSPGRALARSLQLGKAFSSKLVEINLVMGIVNLALIVLAMVLSAAPLPFGDQLGADTLHGISMAAVLFYLLASDYFQLVRLKGCVEFWKMFRGVNGP